MEGQDAGAWAHWRDALGADIDPTGNIALVNADVLSAMLRIPDASVDLVVTSPPYWTAVEYDTDAALPARAYEDYIGWLGRVWLECFRALRPNGKLVINTPIMPVPKRIIKQTPRHLKNIFADIEAWLLEHSEFLRYSLYVWQKQTSKMMFGSYPYPPNILENNTTEFLAVYAKPGAARRASAATKAANMLKQYEWLDLAQQVWFMYPADVKREFKHPAPFPLKLPARFMKMYTFGASEDHAGDIVLDPFHGAGTTALAAKMLRRRCIGIELSRSYHRMAQARLAQCPWGADLNWLVGRPSFLKAEELDAYRSRKEREEEDRESLSKDEVRKTISKHKRARYGRDVRVGADGGNLFAGPR